MASYVVTAANGKKYKIDAPEGTSNLEVEEAFRTQTNLVGKVTQDPAAYMAELQGQYNTFKQNDNDANYGLVPRAMDNLSTDRNAPPRALGYTPPVDDRTAFGKKAGDLATGLSSSVFRALGSTAGLGTYIKGVNQIADPMAETLYGMADKIDENLLSDTQKAAKRELQRQVQNSVKDLKLPEGANFGEKIRFVTDHILAQGGGAASFLKENPTQIFNFLTETIPYIVGGGALGRGTKSLAEGIDALATVGSKTKQVTSKVASMGGGTAGSIGEGLIAAGDVGAGTAIDARAEGNSEYDPKRLLGLFAAPVTALIGRAGSKYSRDVDTFATGIADSGTDLVKRGLVKRVGIGAGVEGAEELLQSGSEEMFSNLAGGRPAYEGVGGAAVIGLATGSALGAGMNVLPKKGGPSNSETELSTEDAIAGNKSDIAQELNQQAEETLGADYSQKQPALFKLLTDGKIEEFQQTLNTAVQVQKDVADQKAAEQAAIDVGQKKLRREVAKTFTPEKFKKARETQRVAELNDPSTPLGQKFETYLDSTDAISQAEIKAEQKAFLDDYSKSLNETDETIRDEYKAELDVQISMVANGAVQAAPTSEQTPTQTPKTATAKPESEKIAAARAYAVEQLGEDWASVGGLSQRFDAKKSIYKLNKSGKSAWQSAVDAEVVARDTANNPVASVEERVDTLTQPSENTNVAMSAVTDMLKDGIKGQPLTVDQTKVANLLVEAYSNNEEDSVQDSKGRLNHERIKEKLGLQSRQASQSIQLAFREKIAGARNLTSSQVKKRLNETKVQNVEEFDLNAGTETFDVADLGAAAGTLQSIGELAEQDRGADEIQATNARAAAEPNVIADQRADEARARRADVKKELATLAQEVDPETALNLWSQLKPKNAPNASALPPEGLRDLLLSVLEYTSTNGSDIGLLEQDFQQIAREAQQDTSEVIDGTTENNQVPAVESQADNEKVDTPASDKTRSGDETDPSGTENTDKQPSKESVEEKPYEFTAEDVLSEYTERGDGTPTLEQAQNVANVRNGMLAKRGNQQAKSKENAPADDEDYRPVDKKPTAKFSVSATTPADQPLSTVQTLENLADRMFYEDHIRRTKRIAIKVEDTYYPASSNNAYSPIRIHKTKKDALRAINNKLPAKKLKFAKAFVFEGVSHFIAENIPKNEAAGTFIHEVGVHLGLENLLNGKQVATLAEAVRSWSTMDESTQERKIYDLVVPRLAFARLTGLKESATDIETIAYAVEEAVILGVQPTNKSQNKAERWLADVSAYLRKIVRRMASKNRYVAEQDVAKEKYLSVLTPLELVSLAHGAARGVMQRVVVREDGALTSNRAELIRYYAAEDRNQIMQEDTNIMSFGKDGEEIFSWGKNSQFGTMKMSEDSDETVPITNIETSAFFDENNSMAMFVRAEGIEGAILSIVLKAVETGNVLLPYKYSLTINGPDGEVESSPLAKQIVSYVQDKDGDDWTKLSGVRRAHTMRILAEARRRMTRRLGGNIPNIEYNRVTGAAAKLLAGGKTKGEKGQATYNEVYARFSMQRQDAGSSVRDGFGREKVREYAGAEGVQFYDGIYGLVTKPKDYLKFLYDYVADAEIKMPSIRVVYDQLKSAEAITNSLVRETEAIIVRAKKLKPERYAAVNDFLARSTFYQKWGYDPTTLHPEVFKDKKVKVDPLTAADFNRLNKNEKQIVADIFAQGEARLKRKKAFIEGLGIVGNFFTSSSLQGPYAPLKRFGKNIAVLRSQTLLDAEKALAANETKENKKTVQDLKGKSEHYVVQFFDTLGAANRFAEKNEGTYARVAAFKREDGNDYGRAPSTAMLESLLGKLKADTAAGMDDATKESFRTMIREHYFESMDERDARTSGARRLNRAGYDKDMIRSFGFQSTAEARLIATMETASDVNEAMASANKEAAEDPGELKETYNLMSSHYSQMMRKEDGLFHALQDRVLAWNTVSMLTTNYGYHVQNATQVLIGVNKLYGDFGSYTRAWTEMFKAYAIANKAIKGGFFKQVAAVGTLGLVDVGNNVEIDNTDGVMPKEYQPLIRELELHQLADVGIQEDLAGMNRFDTGYGLLNKASDKVAGVTHRLYQVARYVEAHNRLSTAIAAYEMAKRNPARLRSLKVTNATDYAIQAVQHTQGAFNGLDAPLAFKTLPKVMTQYRKYQVMMAWNYGRATKQAFAGETTEIKLIGWRTLGATLTHAAIVSGAKGLPLITSMAGLAMLWGADDDDEIAEAAKAANGYDNYVEQVIRENVDNEDIANLLTRGVPAYFGLDLSGKIGHQNIFAFQPYSDLEFTRDGLQSYLFDIAFGPTASTVRNFGGGVEAIKNGQVAKGIGLFLPKGARQYIETYGYATDGIKANNDDLIVDPRKIALSDLIMNATGLPATEIQNLKFTRGQQFKINEYFTNRTAEIQRQYLKANKNRDKDSKSDLREEWRELQRAKRRIRPFFNNARGVLMPSPVSDLIRKPRAQKKREKTLQRRLGFD